MGFLIRCILATAVIMFMIAYHKQILAVILVVVALIPAYFIIDRLFFSEKK